jgi:membrane-bound lytic murein transglycosylase B
MSAPRFGRLQKASALLPLALLSTAWTASLTGVGASTATAGEELGATLPDGTSIPTEAIEAPASVSVPGEVAPGIKGSTTKAISNASTSGIPAAALAAYQRAETVINAADKSCNISWQLVAAIGRVESDHGRANGNALNADGLAEPGIFGIALDGRQGTAVITDTDAGQYDFDSEFDRAVGPMQFIPSTWSVVGVDADGDAERNPQDIDDAALATAVYLCSGREDLGSEEGQREAVYRYNHSQAYVDLVLSIMNAYLEGDFMAVPNGTTSAGFFVPAPTPPAQQGGGQGNGGPGNGGGSGDDGGSTTPPPTTEPAPQPEPDDPTGPIETPDDDGDTNLPVPTSPPPLPEPSLPPVDDVLTEAEAVAECLADGLVDNPLDDNDAFDQCVDNLLNP